MWKASKYGAIFMAFTLLALTGCAGSETLSNDERWRAAMVDAVFSEDDEVMRLVTLTREDPYVIWDEAGERVLLLTWHNYEEPCAPGDMISPEHGEIWATSLGEMADWYGKNSAGVTDWELRFAQLLGMPGDTRYSRFTAFWIAPEDVIRPAYLTDVTIQMENSYESVTDPEYKAWFDGNILYSYFESEYPWTRLGYTYDWSGGDSEYGLTEFLVEDPGKTEIAFTYTTEEFVDWLATEKSMTQ